MCVCGGGDGGSWVCVVWVDDAGRKSFCFLKGGGGGGSVFLVS